MSDYKTITDAELQELFRAKLLSGTDEITEQLLDVQAKLVFTTPGIVADLPRESDLLKKAGTSGASKFSAGWLLGLTALCLTLTVTLGCFYGASENHSKSALKKFSRAPLRPASKLSKEPAAVIEIPQASVIAKVSLPTAVLNCEENKPPTSVVSQDTVSDVRTSDTKTATPAIPSSQLQAIAVGLSPEQATKKELQPVKTAASIVDPRGW